MNSLQLGKVVERRDSSAVRQQICDIHTSKPVQIFLALLVAVCGLLSSADHSSLGPLIWNHFIEDADNRTAGPVCGTILLDASNAYLIHSGLFSVQPVCRASSNGDAQTGGGRYL